MGDWWIDESLPAGPVEQERIPITDWSRAIIVSPATKRALDKLKDKLDDLTFIVYQGQHIFGSYQDEIASASTHTNGNAYDFWCKEECCRPKQEPKKKRPDNFDKGNINNTGPRRGQTFQRGRKRY